jgi:hypothetical protein
MAVPDFAHGIRSSFLQTMTERAQAARQAKASDAIRTVAITPKVQTAQADAPSSFLGDLLDVVNPLQHFPVVSTLYRAATGDKIGDVERVAGDTLYGGLMGLGSSLANIAFREITGKDFGDTMLSWLDGGDTSKPTALADASTPKSPVPARAEMAKLAQAATPAALFTAPAGNAAAAAPSPQPAAVTPAQATMLADPSGFMAALKAKGVDPTLGLRAMAAYQKSLNLGDKALQP